MALNFLSKISIFGKKIITLKIEVVDRFVVRQFLELREAKHNHLVKDLMR